MKLQTSPNHHRHCCGAAADEKIDRHCQDGDFAWGFGHSALLAKCHPFTRVTRSPKVKHSEAEVKVMQDHVDG